MILNRCTCEETQAATGTHGPCSFCHAGGGEGAPVTAPLDMQGIGIALALARVGSWKAVGDHPATASVNSIVNSYAPALLAEVERLTNLSITDQTVALAAEIVQVSEERDEARALLVEVAELCDVAHNEDSECRGDDFPKGATDIQCDDGCPVAHHHEVMERVRAAAKQ